MRRHYNLIFTLCLFPLCAGAGLHRGGYVWPYGGASNDSLHRVKREGFPQHGVMTAPEIIHERGYPVEIHKVVTKDGYVLEMHRIPGPHRSLYSRFKHLPGRGRPVYIQHCVLCSSGDFVLNDHGEALAFVMADKGFDVWLGNYRGNAYSRHHMALSPKDAKFWKFSFMEMAHYDIPAMIYHILDTTGHQNVSYVGHSMGTTGLFAAVSLMPELNKKIRVFGAMAPVVYLDHIVGPMRYLFQFHKYTYRVSERLNNAEMLPRSKTRAALARAFCKPGSFLMRLCQAWLPAFSGTNQGYIEENYTHVVLSHIPAGTSARTLAHLGQLVDAGRFQMFDLGKKGNLREYGETYAPSFEIRHTWIPVGLFWSDNDWVSRPGDVERIARDLPHVALNYRVPQEDFNHLDFLFSKTAKAVLYDQLTQFILDH